jgi:hypothetical protein
MAVAVDGAKCGVPDRSGPVTNVPESDPILGFRCWQGRDDGRLCSIKAPAKWKPGANHARCIQGVMPECEPHRAPEPSCVCGLYAYQDLNHRREWFYDRPNLVMGTIAAWGEIEIVGEGFRAEYAEILALANPRASTRPQRLAARRYGVHLVPFADLARFSLQFAQPLERPVRDVKGGILLVIDCGPNGLTQMEEIRNGCLSLLQRLPDRAAHAIACGSGAVVLPNSLDPDRQIREGIEMLVASADGPALARGVERARGRVLWAHRRWSIDLVVIATQPPDTETSDQLRQAHRDGARTITVCPTPEAGWDHRWGEHIAVRPGVCGDLAEAIRDAGGCLREVRDDQYGPSATRREIARREIRLFGLGGRGCD